MYAARRHREDFPGVGALLRISPLQSGIVKRVVMQSVIQRVRFLENGYKNQSPGLATRTLVAQDIFVAIRGDHRRSISHASV